MCEANMFVMPDIVFIGSTVLLESIHALQHSGIGVAKHACDTAHESSTQTVPFQGMFRISEISLPKWVLEHHHSQQDNGDCKGHSVCDLGWVRVGGFVGHVLH